MFFPLSTYETLGHDEVVDKCARLNVLDSKRTQSMELLFIRHGEAETPRLGDLGPDRLSVIDRYASGTYKGDLTVRGVEQAERIAEVLSSRRVTHIFSSPVARAFQTAEVSSRRLGLSIETTDDLREINIGFLRPHEHPLLRARMSLALLANQIYAKVSGRPVFLPVALYFVVLYLSKWVRGKTEGGEPVSEVRARISRLLRRLEDEGEPGDRVALFTHGYLIHYMTNHVVAPHDRLRRMLERPYVGNGSITRIISRPNGWEVASYADPGPSNGSFGIGGG